MKVALLGPNGQLGSDFRRLVAQEAPEIELTSIARDALDVTDSEAIKSVLSGQPFDILINGTSYHKTDEVEGNAALAVAVNAHAVRDMARICADRGRRFLHISTDYVYGADQERKTPYVEGDGVGPVNVYGATKVLGETLARSVGDPTILRVASLFGVAGASGKGGNFVETMIRVGRERGALRVVDDQRMSPTATADIARMILAMLHAGAPAGTFHAVNSGNASWFEFARTIIETAGVSATVAPIPSSEYPTPAMRPRYSVLDNSALSSIVGDIPHWQDALARYLRAKGHV